MLRILFLNTWGGELWDEIREYILTEGVGYDVLCFSEVHRYPNADTQLATPTLPGRRNGDIFVCQYEALCDLLPEHDRYYTPHSWFSLHDLERSDKAIRYGNGMFISDRLITVGFHSRMVHRRFNQHNDGVPAARSIQGAIIIKDDQPYVIAHFHGIWTGGGKGDTDDRLEQSRRAAGFLMDLTAQCRRDVGTEPRVILGGDLNLTSETKSLQMLAAADAFRGKGRILNHEFNVTDTRTSHYDKAVREADFALVSQNVKVVSFDALVEPEVSDHRPLVLECE